MSSSKWSSGAAVVVECLSFGVHHFGKRISAPPGMARCHSMGRWFILPA